MNKLYLLCGLLFITAAHISAQETTTPVINKSQRIVLHFKDTAGLFNQVGRILIDRGHDIAFKDREFGIISTKSGPMPNGWTYTQQMEIKTIFRDSTITLSGVIHWGEIHYDAYYSKRDNSGSRAWHELMQICEQLKPESISYLPAIKLPAIPTTPEVPKGGRF
jgi:hypothetical protein